MGFRVGLFVGAMLSGVMGVPAGAQTLSVPYAVKPWADPGLVVLSQAAQARMAGGVLRATARSSDAVALPQAAQPILRRFVCDTRPQGLVYDPAMCATATVSAATAAVAVRKGE